MKLSCLSVFFFPIEFNAVTDFHAMESYLSPKQDLTSSTFLMPIVFHTYASSVRVFEHSDNAQMLCGDLQHMNSCSSRVFFPSIPNLFLIVFSYLSHR